ncbi:hypothetical protein J4411_03725 [Candidatus Pacearchaeota archaeon]|nr:hypothetical protein [Candidatus Pacearchaeota archaeon]
MVGKLVSAKGVHKVGSSGLPVQSVKNNISIIFGALSVLISFLIPYAVAIIGVVGIILAYTEKGKVLRKSNLWAFVLNVVGLFLAILFLTLSLVALVLLNGSEILNGA